MSDNTKPGDKTVGGRRREDRDDVARKPLMRKPPDDRECYWCGECRGVCQCNPFAG